MNNKAKISIVGAGPGDPDLLTIKAAKALANADAVLFDALVNKELIQLAPKNAIRLFVGKRAGIKSYTQEEINLLMVQHAFEYGHVVRLKGGDPFIFGRGYEELEYIRAFDIETEIIPGISSSHAVAALQGVPVTSRGYSESFWVMTGTTRTGQLSKDIALAVQSSATVVILMGIKKLAEIVDLYSENHRSQTPIMVVQNGSRDNERVVLATISTIVEQVKRNNIGTPGIILIGETVRLHEQWSEIKLNLKSKGLLTDSSLPWEERI